MKRTYNFKAIENVFKKHRKHVFLICLTIKYVLNKALSI
ncbi:MAG: hypothetical protein JWQ57_1611 [Mucilaginibacter sp.]|nr:hypothetical protein [Mucilaginibacter sp.]